VHTQIKEERDRKKEQGLKHTLSIPAILRSKLSLLSRSILQRASQARLGSPVPRPCTYDALGVRTLGTRRSLLTPPHAHSGANPMASAPLPVVFDPNSGGVYGRKSFHSSGKPLVCRSADPVCAAATCGSSPPHSRTLSLLMPKVCQCREFDWLPSCLNRPSSSACFHILTLFKLLPRHNCVIFFCCVSFLTWCSMHTCKLDPCSCEDGLCF